MTPSVPVGNPRLAAVMMLQDVLDRKKSLAESTFADGLSDPRDRAFANHLSYSVLRALRSLEWLSSSLMRRPLKSRDRDIHFMLLVGLSQLLQDDTAPHAAIHETAECARLAGKSWAVGLVNAILRRFQREREALLARLKSGEPHFEHPDWLLLKLQQDWPDDWQDIARANNRAAPLWLRINRAWRGAGNLHESFGSLGFSLQGHPVAPDAAKVIPPAPVESLPGFDQGRFSVQDPAAQLAADVLDLQNHHRVLDACAAPGGKSCHMLEREGEISVTAVDRSTNRMNLISRNLSRLGFSEHPGVRLVTGDAGKPEDWWDGLPFNRILLDAPCTATGVIRRHPEIRWLRTPEQLAASVRVQSRLLRRLWPLLQAGGMLVYATCSVLKDENSRQINQFVVEHADSELTGMDFAWGRPQDAGRQILPGEMEMDGFYYARLRKTA